MLPHLSHIAVLRQLVNLRDHAIHLLRHDLLLALVNDPAADFIGKRHARYQKDVRRILLHRRCQQFLYIHGSSLLLL